MIEKIRALTLVLIITVLRSYTVTGVKFDLDRITRQLDTIKQHTCENNVMEIKCPDSTIITIKFAQYGRQVPSSQMCPSKTWKLRSYRSLHSYSHYGYIQEDLNCLAKTSLQVLLDKCENLNKCHLVAGTETFQQDPCPDTSKYLEVHYQCRPNEFTSESVCEGEEMRLWCKRSSRIAIYSAMFGRTPNDTSRCQSNKQGFIDCKAKNVVEEVTKRCHGKKQCYIEAEEYIFGNPCPSGINKYLNITYICVPKNILKKLRRRGNRRKKKKDEKLITTTVSADSRTTKSINKPSITPPPIYQKPSTTKPELVPADAAGPEIIEKDPHQPKTYTKDNIDKKDLSETTDSTVICMNVTAKIDVGSSKEQNAWFVLLREMFNAWHYLKANEERVILYFVIAICLAIILMLTALLIKIGTDFKRSIRAKLDVTEPTHSHNYNSHNHTSMETPMLDGSDSLDRIEVVRFSPRGTLRNNDPGNRSLSNYYG